MALGFVAAFVASYYGIAALQAGEPARSLATPFDAALPFVPEAVYVYASTYLGAFLPLWTVPELRSFRRVALAYLISLGFCAACFVAWPVSAATLRPDLIATPDAGFTLWAVGLLYRWDPPLNLFPSLHLALATCAAQASQRAQPRLAVPVWSWVAAVAVAACLTKQHFVVDLVVGIAVGWIAFRLAVGSANLRTRSTETGLTKLVPLVALYIGTVGLFVATWALSHE